MSYYFLHIRDTNVTILFLFQDITSTPFKKSTLTEKYKSPRKEKKKDVLFPLLSLRIIEEENAKNIKISSWPKIIEKQPSHWYFKNTSPLIFSTRFSNKSTLIEKYKSPRKKKRKRERGGKKRSTGRANEVAVRNNNNQRGCNKTFCRDSRFRVTRPIRRKGIPPCGRPNRRRLSAACTKGKRKRIR